MTYSLKNLPNYSKEEEIINSSSHFIGALFGIGIFIYFIVINIIFKKSFISIIPFYIYSLFMIFMFFMSGFYHSRRFHSKSRAISRVIDHSDIYLFIAATYTPVSIYGINSNNIKIPLLIIIWVLALVGIILNNNWIDKLPIKIISLILYIVMGWLIAFLYPFNIGISFNVFLYLLLGGITYTLGSVIYCIGKKKKYFHCIFHIFVLAGAVLQFIAIYYLLINII